MVQKFGKSARFAPAFGAQALFAPTRLRRLREGFGYEEIAAEESATSERIRQIVSGVFQQRAADSGADHAKLHWNRLAPKCNPRPAPSPRPARRNERSIVRRLAHKLRRGLKFLFESGRNPLKSPDSKK